MDVVTSFIVGELSLPHVSTKRDQYEDQHSPREEGSSKRSRVSGHGPFREENPFMLISNVSCDFSPWV